MFRRCKKLLSVLLVLAMTLNMALPQTLAMAADTDEAVSAAAENSAGDVTNEAEGEDDVNVDEAQPYAGISGYQITFNTNYPGTDKKNASATVTQLKMGGLQKTIEKLLESTTLDLTYPGASLVSWNTKANGKGTSYAPTDKPKATMTLYAQWETGYTITFEDGAYGQSSLPTQTFVLNLGETPAPQTPVLEGYTFKGWSPEVTAVTGDATYVGTWDPEVPKPTKNKPAPVTDKDIYAMQIRASAEGVQGGQAPSCSLDVSDSTTSAVDLIDSYELSEVRGNDVDGYFMDVTFHFAKGDGLEKRFRATFNDHNGISESERGYWEYDFSAMDETQVLHLVWSWKMGSLSGPKEWHICDENGEKLYTNIKSATSLVIKAVLKKATCTVTYTDGADGTVFEAVSYTVDKASKTPAYEGEEPTREGYIFKGWSPEVADTVMEDVTYEAVWEEITDYTLNVQVNCDCPTYGAHCVSWVAVTVNGEEKEIVSAAEKVVSIPVKTGDHVELKAVAYDSIGMTQDGGPLNYVTKWMIGDQEIAVDGKKRNATQEFDVAKKDIDVTAVFTMEEKHRLIFDINDSTEDIGEFKGMSTTPKDVCYYYYYPGDVMKLNDNRAKQNTAVRRVKNDNTKRYVLTGWNTKADGTGTAYTLGSLESITMGHEDVTLYAQWEKTDGFKYTFTLGEGGSEISYIYREGGLGAEVEKSVTDSFDAYVSYYDGSFSGGVYYYINAVPKKGYEFDGWYIGGKKVAGDISKLKGLDLRKLFPAITENTTVEARFVFKGAKVSASVDCSSYEDQIKNCVSWVMVYVNDEKLEMVSAFDGKYDFEVAKGDTVRLEAVAYDSIGMTQDGGPLTYVTKWIVNGEEVAVEAGQRKATYTFTAEENKNMDVTAVIELEEKHKLIFEINDSIDEMGMFKGMSTMPNTACFYYYYPGDKMMLNDNHIKQNTAYRKAKEEDKNYVLTGWNTKADGTGTAYTLGSLESITMGHEDVTLYAQWEKVDATKYIFTLGEGGSKIEYTYREGGIGKIEQKTTEDSFDAYVSKYDGSFKSGVYYYINAVPKKGYEFDGWYIGGKKVAGDISKLKGMDLRELFLAITENTTVEARFTPDQFTISFNSDGAGEFEPKKVDYNEAIGELPTPVKDGYTFSGWVDADGKEVTAETVYAVANDSTYTAKWNANSYTIKLDAGDGSEPTTKEVVYGEAIGELPVPAKDGYTFAGWVDADGKEVTAETVYAAANDSTYTAKWNANSYTITLDAGNGSEPTTKEVVYGEAIGELPVPAKDGYTFAGWVDADGKEVTAETVYAAANESTYTAKWNANSYTITLDAGDGGEPTTKEVVYGEAIGELPVPVKDGYVFAGWVDADGKEVTAETVYAAANDSTYTAKWTEEPVTKKEFYMGDANLNGEIEAADALLVLKHVVKLTTLAEVPAVICDMDGDGEMSTVDALKILQTVVNLIDKRTITLEFINDQLVKQ